MQDGRSIPSCAGLRVRWLRGAGARLCRRDEPDWILELSHERIDPGTHRGADAALLVVQQDRRDGTDLLTLRYPLAQRGAVRTYAGAGLNQAFYFAEESDGATLLTCRDRHRSLGAAAEADATLLRSAEGLVGVDPVSVGVSVGWRFR